jgi:choice-of-anchor C domain-containing protein
VDTVISTLAISITGVAVEAGNLDDGTVVDATVATGQMVSSDVDNGATVTWTHSGSETPVYGSFAITPAGVWTYAVDATPGSAADMMNEGDEYLETFGVTVTDQHGAAAIETVTVLIKGTNDSPIAVEDTYLGDNIIVNGDFENPDVEGEFTILGAGETIGAWSIDSGSVDLTTNEHWPASEGDQSLNLNGDNAGTISQSFATVTGTTYTVTFDMSANGNVNDIVQMIVSAAGVTANYQYDANQNTMTAMNWSPETFTFVATSATTTLEFEGLESSPPWGGIALDNVQVRAINAELSTDENTAITTDVLANDTDVDSGDAPGNFSLDAVSIASGLPDNPTGTPATVSIVDNKLVFNPGADFDYLAAGESATVVVNYTMSDDADAVSGSTATIIVTGDEPTITVPDVKVILEDDIAMGNVLENDVDIDSSLSVVSFVLAGDATVYTAGAPAPVNNIGTITIAANGDYSFTPVANWSGEVPQITYTTNTGVNDTLDVTVTPVADAPTLIMNMGEPEVSGTGQVIDLSDSNGGNLFAYADSTAINFANLADTGATLSFNPGNGLGVETTNESQADGAAVLDGTEAAVIVLANGAGSVVQVDVRHVDNEPALVQVYNVAGELRGYTEATGANNADITIEVDVSGSMTSDATPKYVVVSGPDDLNGGKNGFNIAGVRTVGTGTSLFTYRLSVVATLTDVDGSESLGSVFIEASTIPADVTVQDAYGAELTATGGFYTVTVDADGAAALTLVSDDVLTSAEINAISGSVTATETTGIANPVADQSATSTEPALLEIFADAGANELTGFDGSELIKGMDGDDIIIGGDGDDVIFGGKGADTLTGGLGTDTFIWSKADADGSTDAVTDFNIAEGDSLNLADLLSDGSHTIDGVDNGGDLQLVISDTNSNVVQTINLTDVSIAGNAADTLQSLLDNGDINDGI